MGNSLADQHLCASTSAFMTGDPDERSCRDYRIPCFCGVCAGAAARYRGPESFAPMMSAKSLLRSRSTRKSVCTGRCGNAPAVAARPQHRHARCADRAQPDDRMPPLFQACPRNGVKPGEISEIITHLAFYSGWANAMSASSVAQDVFAAREIGSRPAPGGYDRTSPLDEAAEADRAARVGQQFGAVAPGIVQYTTDFCSATVAASGPRAARPQPRYGQRPDRFRPGRADSYHLNRAMDNGLTQEQAAESSRISRSMPAGRTLFPRCRSQRTCSRSATRGIGATLNG